VKALISAAVLGIGALAACFSDREPSTATGGVCNIDLGEAFPGSTVVVIRGFVYDPGEVRVRVGDRVTWLNCDQDPHTSTADGGQWASLLLAAGDGFTQTFTAAGDFPYHCDPHPFMVARVIVE
jgi:plastocyanin